MAEQVWNHHFIQANGIRLHYVRQGTGMPLVLLGRPGPPARDLVPVLSPATLGRRADWVEPAELHDLFPTLPEPLGARPAHLLPTQGDDGVK